jgi:hypothetical protein
LSILRYPSLSFGISSVFLRYWLRYARLLFAIADPEAPEARERALEAAEATGKIVGCCLSNNDNVPGEAAEAAGGVRTQGGWA